MDARHDKLGRGQECSHPTRRGRCAASARSYRPWCV